MERRDYVFVSLLAACFLVAAGFLLHDTVEPYWKNRQNIAVITALPEKSLGERVDFPVIPEVFPGNSHPAEWMPESKPELEPEDSEPPVLKGPLPFVQVGYEYFEDALFVGDSRMEGIAEYGQLENATFFADAGMSVFSLGKKRLPIGNEGKFTFEEVLAEKQYAKVYLMLGLNELGYKEEAILEKYRETVEQILASQEDAILFVCANMHVTEKQNRKENTFTNEKLNRVNEMISRFADGQSIIYIDVNEMFDDENGNLRGECSSDGFHVYARHYKEWVDWLCTKGIEKKLAEEK